MELVGYKKFLELRRMVMNKLESVDMRDGHKSYEGTFELLLSYPNYFDEQEAEKELNAPDFVNIILHCYVLGPARHYEWKGATIEEAVKKVYEEIKGWE